MRRLKVRKSAFIPLPNTALSMRTRDARLASGYERDYERALAAAASREPKRLFNLLQAGRKLTIQECETFALLLSRYLKKPRGRPRIKLEPVKPKRRSLADAIADSVAGKHESLLQILRARNLYNPKAANILVQYLEEVLPHRRGSPKKVALHQAAILAHSLLEWARALHGRLHQDDTQRAIEYARINTERWTGAKISSSSLRSLMRESKSRVG